MLKIPLPLLATGWRHSAFSVTCLPRQFACPGSLFAIIPTLSFPWISSIWAFWFSSSNTWHSNRSTRATRWRCVPGRKWEWKLCRNTIVGRCKWFWQLFSKIHLVLPIIQIFKFSENNFPVPSCHFYNHFPHRLGVCHLEIFSSIDGQQSSFIDSLF